MSVEQNKQLYLRFSREVIEQGNRELIDELLAPDFVEHEVIPGIEPNLKGVKQALAMFHTGITDLNIETHELMGEGDKVMARQTWRGTHGGALMGVPATGNKIEYPVADVVRVRDGKIVEHWAVSDNLALMTQIDAVPTAEAAGL